MLDGEKLQVKYFLLSFLLFICKSCLPPIYLLLQVFRVGLTPPPPPSSASMGPEMDLIRIQECAFDLPFVKQMQPHDSLRRGRGSAGVHTIMDGLIAL